MTTGYKTTCDQAARALAHEYIHGDRVYVIRQIEMMHEYRSRAVVALMVGRYLNQSAQSFIDTIVMGAKHTDPPTPRPIKSTGDIRGDELLFSPHCDSKCDRCNLDG